MSIRAGSRSSSAALTLVLLLALGGCAAQASATRARTPDPEPRSLARTAATPDPSPDAEEDPALPDRWKAPFAVTSLGRTAPREPYPVVIIAVDPALVPGLEAVHGSDLELP